MGRRVASGVSISRALPLHREPFSNVDLHCFGDASGKGVCAALYAVITQTYGSGVGLVTVRARLVKLGLSIPRLELVSGHMATNLITNARAALKGFPIGELHCWLDRIKGAGEIVSGQEEHSEIKWRHVKSEENPADLGSRGGSVEGVELWWKGPKWLADREQWPRDIVTVSTPESQAEAKVVRKGFAGARDKTDEFDVLLEKFPFRKTFRVGAWILRFVYNNRKRKSERTIGPIATEEIEQQKCFWTACEQRSGKTRRRSRTTNYN